MKLDAEARVKKDSTAVIRFAGLMGQNFVALSFGSPAAPLVELHEVADDGDEVVLGQDRLARRRVEAQALIDLEAAHAAEVVPLGAEEQAVERLLGRLLVGRIARTEQRVDGLERLGLAELGVRRLLVAAAATGMKSEDESKLFRFTLRHSVFLASVIGLLTVLYAFGR